MRLKSAPLALALVVACATFSGAAFAGPGSPPGQENATTPPGNSENAPGQEKKAEADSQPAAASNAATPSKGKSASAPGKTKSGKAATPTKGKSAQAKGQQQTRTQRVTPQQQGGRSAEAHHHVIVCHRTGSDSNPYVVINIPMTAWTEAHSPETGSHPTLNGRDDILLKDPASRPGSKDGFTKDDCVQVQAAAPPPPPPPPGNGGKEEEQQQAAVVTVTPVTPPAEPGEVAGAEAVITQPKADEPGGVLGALADIGEAELPFTGLPLWIAALAGIALVGAGLGARRAMR